MHEWERRRDRTLHQIDVAHVCIYNLLFFSANKFQAKRNERQIAIANKEINSHQRLMDLSEWEWEWELVCSRFVIRTVYDHDGNDVASLLNGILTIFDMWNGERHRARRWEMRTRWRWRKKSHRSSEKLSLNFIYVFHWLLRSQSSAIWVGYHLAAASFLSFFFLSPSFFRPRHSRICFMVIPTADRQRFGAGDV